MEAIFCPSNIGCQVLPALVLFQTPPATAPKYQVAESPGTPLTATTRPPRNGPIWRHFMPPSKAGSMSGAAALHSHGASTSTTRVATDETNRRVIFFYSIEGGAYRTGTCGFGHWPHRPAALPRRFVRGRSVGSIHRQMIVRRRQPNCGAFDTPRRAARAGFCNGNVEHFILTSGCRRQQLDEEAGGVFAPGNQLGHFSLLHIIDAGFCRRSLGPPD